MIPQATPPPGYRFRDVQLEMSLKPFWDASPATREAVCRELFEQWRPLCRRAETISVLLWIGDGSEILEYEGNPDHVFEWGRYHGSANAIHANPVPDDGHAGHTAINGHILGRDPERRGVHLRSYLYRAHPAEFTFRWLRELVVTLKAIGREMTGKPILVGETFDIGPEFAVSRFKYEWHREICGGGALFGGKFIRCDRALDPDTRTYAGFPDGIPPGTSVGTFVGRQTQRFFTDLGFDFLWLSNGFGFALEPWALTGALFDGAEFHRAAARETSEAILRFWHDLRRELPAAPIRTRGTNLGTGIDLASDASPIREIFRDVPGVEAPVNSPWAALDGDVGLELAGWMSHIARLPRPGYRYRYYIHDPWWLNSPWLDRYQRQPFDIHLPLAVCRVLPDGSVEPPSDLAFLSVDDSHGRLPPTVPVEVTAHLLHAREFLPDEPGPIVWIYPFDAVHDLVQSGAPDLPFFGDWFVRGLITHSVPVNTVADARDALPLLEAGKLSGPVLLAPALPDASGLNDALLAHARRGGRVLVYGPLDRAPGLAAALGIICAEPLDGDFAAEGSTAAGRAIRHLAVLSGGGWTETGGHTVTARGRQGPHLRTAAAHTPFPSGGVLAWVRGSLATAEYDPAADNKILGPRLTELPSDRFLPTETLARDLLDVMGWRFAVHPASSAASDPILCLHRHANGFVFSGYQPDPEATLHLALPPGAPVFTGHSVAIEQATTRWAGPPSWHLECRVFVLQEEASQVRCQIVPPIQHGATLRLLVSGLRSATVRFFPEPGTAEKLEILRAPKFPYFVGDFVTPRIAHTPLGQQVTVEDVTGELLFSW